MSSFGWLAVMIAALIFEAVTAGLVSIWFAFGALAAYIATLFSLSLTWQIAIFCLVSAIALWLTRPLAKRLRAKTKPTNADRLIGEKAVVTKAIDPIENTGTVKVLGQMWSASSLDKSPIPADTIVTVCEIRGAHLVVAPEKTESIE